MLSVMIKFDWDISISLMANHIHLIKLNKKKLLHPLINTMESPLFLNTMNQQNQLFGKTFQFPIQKKKNLGWHFHPFPHFVLPSDTKTHLNMISDIIYSCKEKCFCGISFNMTIKVSVDKFPSFSRKKLSFILKSNIFLVTSL